MTENDQIYSIYKHNASLDVDLFFCFACRARSELPELLEQEVGLLGPDVKNRQEWGNRVRPRRKDSAGVLPELKKGLELQPEQPGVACIGSKQVMFNEMLKGQ